MGQSDFEYLQGLFGRLENELIVDVGVDECSIEITSTDYPDETFLFLFDKDGKLKEAI